MKNTSEPVKWYLIREYLRGKTMNCVQKKIYKNFPLKTIEDIFNLDRKVLRNCKINLITGCRFFLKTSSCNIDIGLLRFSSQALRQSRSLF